MIERNEKRMSSTALFWVCVLLTVGIGLAVAYSSGIFRGVQGIQVAPFVVPDWLVFILPPVMFLHMGVALYFALNENVYTESARSVRSWTMVFWVALFIALAILPYFVFRDMYVTSYIIASLAGGLALGTTILMYQNSVAAGVTTTILLAVVTVIMIYLGYWAFA